MARKCLRWKSKNWITYASVYVSMFLCILPFAIRFKGETPWLLVVSENIVNGYHKFQLWRITHGQRPRKRSFVKLHTCRVYIMYTEYIDVYMWIWSLALNKHDIFQTKYGQNQVHLTYYYKHKWLKHTHTPSLSLNKQWKWSFATVRALFITFIFLLFYTR